MKNHVRVFALLSVAAAAVPVNAVVVFSENFDTDHTANWTFTPSANTATLGDQPADSLGSDLNVYFDYSTVGIPAAPGSATTRGLQMKANMPGTGNIFSGMTTYPVGQHFDFVNKSYKISAYVWMNYHYHPGGSGTTQMTMVGLGATEGTSQFVGDNFNSVMFSNDGDGDTSTDYRAYKTPWPLQGPADTNPGQPAVGRVQQADSGVYPANSLDSANAYYTTNFPTPAVIPQDQKNLFPNQGTIVTRAGELGFGWHLWTVETTKAGGPITWKVDGITLATIAGGDTNPYTLSGDNIYFGQYDINANSAPTGFDADKLLFGLIDNVTVEDLTPAPTLPGDVNSDGFVNQLDLNIVGANWLASGATLALGDANGDTFVNQLDLNLIGANWLAQASAVSALSAVPEPASLGLLAAAAMGLVARRRRA